MTLQHYHTFYLKFFLVLFFCLCVKEKKTTVIKAIHKMRNRRDDDIKNVLFVCFLCVKKPIKQRCNYYQPPIEKPKKNKKDKFELLFCFA